MTRVTKEQQDDLFDKHKEYLSLGFKFWREAKKGSDDRITCNATVYRSPMYGLNELDQFENHLTDFVFDVKKKVEPSVEQRRQQCLVVFNPVQLTYNQIAAVEFMTQDLVDDPEPLVWGFMCRVGVEGA